jgi:hypothetical protein
VTKGKGYLLPSGDATEDELECCLVFYPARDEYRRALMGSLDYLATWIAWERDSEKRGQDAAASWKLANIQTWECCSMGYCDDLLTTLQELLDAVKSQPICCGDQDITDGRQYTDEVEDGVGDVPQNIIDAGYAADAADWTGFADYKCMISHLAVDHVESFFRKIAPHISDTGIVIGGVGVVGALIGGILTVAGLPISAGIIIALGAAAAIWSWITSEGRDAVEDLADEIATNHDALACAIYEGDGVSASIDDFNDEVDTQFTALNAIAIKAINLEPQLRAMYAGRYDQEDIAAKLEELNYDVGDYLCYCPEEDTGELIPDPKMLSESAYWTADPDYTWDPADEGRFMVDVGFPYSYDKLFSAPFTMPMDAPSNDCDMVIRVKCRTNLIATWYIQINDYATEEAVWTGFVIAGLAEPPHRVEDRIPSNQPVTLVKGTEYYARIAVMCDIEEISQWVSGLSLIPIEP